MLFTLRSCKSLLGYSSANLSSSSAAGASAAMYGGFYVLYDEMAETLERDGIGKDDDDDPSKNSTRRKTVNLRGSGKQEWR